MCERVVPRFLMIDTCGAVGRVALTAGDAVAAEAEMPGRTYSERLVGEGMRLLAEMEWTLGDLAAVVVVHGPGSFTGVRVGVSAAKGWAEAAGLPVIALSRLELLAAEVVGPDTVAVLDAGRGEFYMRRGVEERLVDKAELLELAHGAEMVACEAGVGEVLRDAGVVVVGEPGLKEMLRLARERFAAGRFEDVAVLDANYVRRSDAEIFAWGKGSAKAGAAPGDEPPVGGR